MKALARISFLSFRSLPLLLVLPLRGQCADAGICRLNHAPEQAGWGLGISLQSGASGQPDALQFKSVLLEAQAPLWSGGSLAVTVPFHRISGPLGRVSGLGDTVFVLDQRLLEGPSWMFSGQLGARLATGRSDGEAQLPQAYQAGLGPSDLLAGLRFSRNDWAFGLGYQKAGGRSEHPTTRLQRGDDALGWIQWRLSKGAVTTTLKGLAIQRLQVSSMLDGGTYKDVPDSKRLQVNVSAQVAWRFKSGTELFGDVALPLRKRTQNIDGLKRANTFALGLRWQF